MCKNAQPRHWHIPTPDEIENRVRAAGATMAEACRRAGLARSIFTRAKAGNTSLTATSLAKLTAAIEQIEAEAELARRTTAARATEAAE